jgi:hypothetical protein
MANKRERSRLAGASKRCWRRSERGTASCRPDLDPAKPALHSVLIFVPGFAGRPVTNPLSCLERIYDRQAFDFLAVVQILTEHTSATGFECGPNDQRVVVAVAVAFLYLN